MAYDDLTAPSSIPSHHQIPHYYGDTVRAIFVVMAILLIIAQFMTSLPAVSTALTVGAAIALVVVAGVISPAQKWIHWAAAALSAGGVALFGSAAYGAIRGGTSTFDPALVFVLALSVLSLVALYLATKTIRGMMLR